MKAHLHGTEAELASEITDSNLDPEYVKMTKGVKLNLTNDLVNVLYTVSLKCYTLWAVCLYYVRVNICHQHDRHMYQPGFEPATS